MNKKLRSSAARVAFLGMCISCALILSYVELLLPPISTVAPGIKMGLANTMTVFVLYRAGVRPAAIVLTLRILLSSLLFGSAVSLVYSSLGGVISFCLMVLLRKTDKFSPVGVSTAGAVSHNAGQIFGAVILMNTPEISYYFPILAISGTLSGIFVGILGGMLLKTLQNVKLY